MSFKSFLMKKALQFKGMDKDQAESVAKTLEENPEIANSLKAIESNKEVKELFEKIQKEIEEKKKSGMQDLYATAMVMEKYKTEVMKYREYLAPLAQLMAKK